MFKNKKRARKLLMSTPKDIKDMKISLPRVSPAKVVTSGSLRIKGVD
jgi:hypothetical protein